MGIEVDALVPAGGVAARIVVVLGWWILKPNVEVNVVLGDGLHGDRIACLKLEDVQCHLVKVHARDLVEVSEAGLLCFLGRGHIVRILELDPQLHIGLAVAANRHVELTGSLDGTVLI